MMDFLRNLAKGNGTVTIVWTYIGLIVIEAVTKHAVPTEFKDGLMAMALLTIRRGIGDPIQQPKL